MKIIIKNTTGIFDCEFVVEVADEVNWFVLEGRKIDNNKQSLTFDINFQPMAFYKDELGNKYDGFICDETEIMESIRNIEEKTYYFIEEDAFYGM